jgi:acyl-CoA synthetase (AMP-forming)/AMP-acid ligase II
MFYFVAMALTVADLVEHSVDAVPDRVALVCGGRRATYAELEGRANQLAHHLERQGFGSGSHIGVFATNTMETVETLLAVNKLRAVAINVNYRYTENELRYVLSNADAVALVHQRADAAKVAAVLPDLPLLRHVIVVDDRVDDGGVRVDEDRVDDVRVDEDGGCSGNVASGGGGTHDGGAHQGGAHRDGAVTAVDYEAALAEESPERDFAERDPGDLYLIYTGGTTGRPKGVMWRHEDVWRALGGGVDFMTGEPVVDELQQSRIGAQYPMVRLCAAPLIHGQAQWAMYGALFSASTVVLMPRFDAHEIWRAVEREKVNVMAIVGDAMARPLIEVYQAGSYDASSLFAISSSAALFSATVKQQYLDAFPNALLTDAIGSTETGFSGLGIVKKDGMESRGPRVNPHRDAIVIGADNCRLLPGTGVVGRIARGGNVPIGYYKDPDKTAALFVEVEGRRYVVPGDFALLEDDGAITLLGRGDTCINTGGEKVFPEEVEGVLKSHAGVFDALVLGVPDELLGSRVAAVVQWRSGYQPDSTALDRFSRDALAGYKMPRTYWFVDQVPRLATGKPDYPSARRYAERHPPSAQLSVTAGRTSPHLSDAGN